MKPTVILLSLLVSALTWWFGHPKRSKQRQRVSAPLRHFINSIVAGLVAYFILMFIAMIWLLATT